MSVAARLGHGVLGAPELGTITAPAIIPAVVSSPGHGVLEVDAPLVVIGIVVLAVVTASVAILPVGTADLEAMGRGGEEESAQGSERKRDLHFYEFRNGNREREREGESEQNDSQSL